MNQLEIEAYLSAEFRRRVEALAEPEREEMEILRASVDASALSRMEMHIAFALGQGVSVEDCRSYIGALRVSAEVAERIFVLLQRQEPASPEDRSIVYSVEMLRTLSEREFIFLKRYIPNEWRRNMHSVSPELLNIDFGFLSDCESNFSEGEDFYAVKNQETGSYISRDYSGQIECVFHGIRVPFNRNEVAGYVKNGILLQVMVKINNRDTVIGCAEKRYSENEIPIVWKPGKSIARDLNHCIDPTLGWRLHRCLDIDNQDRICCLATGADGTYQIVMLNPLT